MSEAATDHPGPAQGVSILLVDSAEWRVAIPCTARAACLLGNQTDWCTAFDDVSFAVYARAGALFVFEHVPTGRKWQLHPASGEFRDARNFRASWRGLVQREPKLLAMLLAALAALDPTRETVTADPHLAVARM